MVGPKPGESQWVYVGRSRYRFMHGVLSELTTALPDNVWRDSWQDAFADYQEWLKAGEPRGYIWGIEYMTAYPGLTYIDDSAAAHDWTERLESPMHEVLIETNAHNIRLIFHDVDITWLSQGSAL